MILADMSRKPSNIGDGNFIGAIGAAMRDLRDTGGTELQPLAEDSRLDGRICLVTGANSGLGKAAAVELARRGGKLILACRPGHAETPDEIRRESGSNLVEAFEVDLADLDSVHRFCDELAEREIRLDIALLNAGLMTREGRRSAQGFELMFAVHFLANRLLVDRWLADGVIAPGSGRGSDSANHLHFLGIPSLVPWNRFRQPGRPDRIRYQGKHQILRPEQTGLVHLRHRTVAPAQPGRYRRLRGAFDVSRRCCHQYRKGRAGLDATAGKSVPAALLPASANRRQAGRMAVLFS